MKVYKIVANVNGRLISAFSIGPGLTVEYFEGKWVEGRLGPLFAFKDEDAAYWFASVIKDREIWLAEAEGVREVPRIIDARHLLDTKLVKSFWLGACVGEGVLAVPVSGTVVCDRVKLLTKLGVISGGYDG